MQAVVIGVDFTQELVSGPEAWGYIALFTIKTEQNKSPEDLLSESLSSHVLFGHPATRLSLSGALQGDGLAQLDVGETEARPGALWISTLLAALPGRGRAALGLVALSINQAAAPPVTCMGAGSQGHQGAVFT